MPQQNKTKAKQLARLEWSNELNTRLERQIGGILKIGVEDARAEQYIKQIDAKVSEIEKLISQAQDQIIQEIVINLVKSKKADTTEEAKELVFDMKEKAKTLLRRPF